jgi:hypothetical protein
VLRDLGGLRAGASGDTLAALSDIRFALVLRDSYGWWLDVSTAQVVPAAAVHEWRTSAAAGYGSGRAGRAGDFGESWIGGAVPH